MKLVAFSAQAWRISTWRTTGAWPLTSPPLTAATLDLQRLAAEVIYIRLHGLAGQPFLYGDPGFVTALSAEAVRGFRWPGSLVFLEGCFGMEFAQAFIDGGARAVIGNDRPTWGRKIFLGPANRVGKLWLSLIRKGWTVMDALEAAAQSVSPPHSAGWSVIGPKGATL